MYYRDPNSRLGYIPINKNASSTFSAFVQKQGWQRIDDKFESDVKLFAHIQNPWKRFVNGMAQLAWINNERRFSSVARSPFFRMALIDPHIMPISMQYFEVMDKIHFIPMDATRNANTLTNIFFAANGLDARIADSDTKYASNSRKKAYQVEVKKWLETQYAHRKVVMNLHKRDIQAWKEALAYYEEVPPVEPPKTSLLHKFLNRIWTFA